MNKFEFLQAICGKPVLREIEGITVEIRSLTVLETQELSKAENEIEASLKLCILGLINPKLESEDIELLRKAKPGFIIKLAKSISELSGLSDTDSPTVGNG
jgi:hypothetical protein